MEIDDYLARIIEDNNDKIDFLSYKEGCGGQYIAGLIANEYDEYKDVWCHTDEESNQTSILPSFFGNDIFMDLSRKMYKWWIGGYRANEENTEECHIENIKNDIKKLPIILTSYKQLLDTFTEEQKDEIVKWNSIEEIEVINEEVKLLVCIEHPFTGLKKLFPNSKKITIVPKRRIYWSNYAYLTAGYNNFLSKWPSDWSMEQYFNHHVSQSITPKDIIKDVDKLIEWLKEIPKEELYQGTLHYAQYYNNWKYNVKEVNNKEFLMKKLVLERNITDDKKFVESFREYGVEGFKMVSLDDAINTTTIPDLLEINPDKYMKGITLWHNKNMEMIGQWL